MCYMYIRTYIYIFFFLQGKRVGKQGNGRSQVEGCKSHDPRSFLLASFYPVYVVKHVSMNCFLDSILFSCTHFLLSLLFPTSLSIILSTYLPSSLSLTLPLPPSSGVGTWWQSYRVSLFECPPTLSLLLRLLLFPLLPSPLVSGGAALSRDVHHSLETSYEHTPTQPHQYRQLPPSRC